MNPINNREESALDVINQIQFAIKSTVVYPENHHITSEIITKSYELLENILNKQNRLDLSVNGGKLWVNDFSIKPKNNLSANFALELDQRAIRSISFYRGLSRKDYAVFIKAMKQKPPSLRKNGGINSILKNHGVSSIRLNGIKYKKVVGDLKKETPAHIIKEYDFDGDLQEAADSPRQNDFTFAGGNLSAPAARTLKASGQHDTSGQTGDTLFTKIQTNENKLNDLPGEDPVVAASGKLRADLNNFILEGKSDKIRTVIEDISQKMNDKSLEIRKKVAESLQEITSTLDEFDLLKEHFKKLQMH